MYYPFLLLQARQILSRILHVQPIVIACLIHIHPIKKKIVNQFGKSCLCLATVFFFFFSRGRGGSVCLRFCIWLVWLHITFCIAVCSFVRNVYFAYMQYIRHIIITCITTRQFEFWAIRITQFVPSHLVPYPLIPFPIPCLPPLLSLPSSTTSLHPSSFIIHRQGIKEN